MSNHVLIKKVRDNLKEKFIKDCESTQKSLENVTDYVVLAINSKLEISIACGGKTLNLLGLIEYFKYDYFKE